MVERKRTQRADRDVIEISDSDMSDDGKPVVKKVKRRKQN
jgi:hypothetical protein